ncbi:hypothetical protein SAMN02745136_03050 [Anaerocolumna jejuensis DSM 15929]|uniref:GRAM domain-containing protein n=1 Tax=Anaerocolumna jejuensis DSM 15929 TaxID=1121322 RepID=A0A1M6UEE7_9FIRM|nr:GRAM domain-containing protein [Anaerocolumna jejuensis]SHK67541.1 hypothetical protein SAMN02745136_03050 [Anaerocolumna jejuensis DSM 15929]
MVDKAAFITNKMLLSTAAAPILSWREHAKALSHKKVTKENSNYKRKDKRAMNDKKKEKLKNNLVKAGLMEQEDTIIECLQANYRQRLIGIMGQWKQGWIYFTETRVVYPTGLLDNDIVIPYKSIHKIEKCTQGIFPMGISLTYEEPKTENQITDKFSMTKRGKWMDFLADKAGISLG